MSETGGLLEWLAGPDDPGPFPVAGPPGLRAPEVLAAWGAILYHHTGRRDLAFRVLRGGTDEVVRFAIDPGATLAELGTSVTRALGAAGPYDPALGPMPVLVHGDPVPPGALALVLDGDGLRLRPGPARNAGLAARHADHLTAALATPADTAIRDLDPLSPAEHAELDRWNDTAGDYPGDIRVERLFAGQAVRAPGHPAVVHGGTTLTYADLHRRSTLLAQSVRRAGLASGDPVALLLPRVPDLVVAALAVLKSGGCYLPIDPSTPPERVSFLLADSGASLVIASKDAGARTRSIAMEAATRTRTIAMEDLDWSAEPEPEDPAPSDTSAPAYLMYTSGTTGRPKGVAIPHRGIVRLVRGVDYVRLDPTTRMAQVGATGFDASVWEMWGALLNGGTLHLLDRETFLDAEELRKALADQRITTALFTSALFGRLADEDPALFRPLRDLLVGGDVLSPNHARSVLRANPGLRLVNAYGPTENAVISTVHVVAEPIGARVPIGRPVPNASAYVLNQDRRPLPIGVPGDLYVGGAGMAPGYHGRPELTRQAFVPHPLRPGRLLYRTGDRARRLPDGSIDFLGRTDHQVKVRGFRVEPGEVETALLNASGVSGAVVVERRDPFDSRLCAYVTGKEGLREEGVRAEIERVLPPHMVPAHIVVLPALPLTANGKVDRTALPDPARRGGGRAARDEVEHVLVELWEDVLGVRGIGVDDPLDRLGGSSLTATRLAALVRRRFGVECPVSAVLSAGTVSALARAIRSADRTGPPFAGPRPGLAAGLTPLSPQQRGIYVEQLKDPAGTQYNLPIFVDLPAPVDPDPLRAALAALADRHEILRTDIAVDGDGQPHLRVRERLAVTLDEVDLPRCADPDAWAERWIRPFDLARAPLWRVALVRHDTGTRLVLDIHHLLTDGHALALLMSEWAALIRGDRLPEVELRYRDFAQWANGPEKRQLSEAQRPYWAETFARPVRPLDLPTDLPRPAVRRTEGAHLDFELGARRSDAIAELARAEGVTPFHVLLAAYTAFLGRVSGSADVTVGTAASGRHLPGVDRAQGMFVNTLCLRTRPETELPFRAYLRAVAEHATAAVDHQDHAFDALVARHEQHDPGRNPLFDTFFAMQDTGLHRVDFLGGRPRWRPDVTRRTIFDLDLQIEVGGAGSGGYAARWAYATSLFLRPTVELFRDELLALLDAVLAEPGRPLGELGPVAAAPYDLSELALDFDF
ncbi:amino acid adenylation domain-containing protein [Nonomuraea sp. H19]|uniref:amino acid adenylation domain-containing protein n=1 Tax=Nonomuraea sp. H19 TaxID=3452206 RepID=UPI003F8BA420